MKEIINVAFEKLHRAFFLTDNRHVTDRGKKRGHVKKIAIIINESIAALCILENWSRRFAAARVQLWDPLTSLR